ncbi:MAG: hypothetical protein MJ099_01490 [Clostridia bacterium]|nr:hypothetical protein [Clostridia bacterium]
MPRKAQNTKEEMLQAAFEIVQKEGYQAVNIRSVAHALNCSTQPISWQFGTMDNFRKELAIYTLQRIMEDYMRRRPSPKNRFFTLCEAYIDMAFDMPNTMRFLCATNALGLPESYLMKAFEPTSTGCLRKEIAEMYGMNEEQSIRFVEFVAIYIHGFSTLIFNDCLKIEREAAYAKAFDDIKCFRESMMKA